MGRGNVCVFGKYESVYFIPFETFYDYPYNSETDEEDETQEKEYKHYLYDDFKDNLSEMIKNKFKSFSKCDKWLDNETHCIIENNLFDIALQDNQWSIAVKLLCKDDETGLHIKHFKEYDNALLKILFDLSDDVYGYAGAWTSQKLIKQDVTKGH